MESAADHFDLESFEMLKDVMEDEFDDLIQVYIEDSDRRLPQLQQALTAADAAELRELAHSFKGASSNISAVTLTELCRQLEQAGRDEQLDGLEQTLDQIVGEYRWVKNFLQSQLSL
ncbi:Hpt domain-containing protein [Bacterioplanoides pacificum]|uniref:Hpt domain-containing protein n=1 Tax=Bacterioplanoides pacificum TaxID=1171596 RepID=A0ABV7VVD0_9GAMM